MSNGNMIMSDELKIKCKEAVIAYYFPIRRPTGTKGITKNAAQRFVPRYFPNKWQTQRSAP
jgi:hypothetical protein